MADTNKVVFGLKNVHYAVATLAANNSATYATPVAIPGAVNLSMDAQGDSNDFFADDRVYYTSTANNGYEGDLEIAKIPDSFMTDILGYAQDGHNVLYENADAPTVHFALIFEFNGDVHAKRHVLYNCTASRPAVSGATKEASIEPQTQTISIKATSVYNASTNKNVVKASCTPSEATQYNAWLTTVYQVTSATT